ncbi:sensor histidine kinase [Demequina sp.]|uniref:sensor histidine kinase n=1 Tax=Demequina sp. TaxID=2050685 RepID=UPI003A8B40A3
MDFKPRWNDLLIAAGLGMLGLLWAISLEDTGLLAPSRDMDGWGYLLLVAGVVPLIWRLRFPRAVVWATTLIWVLSVGVGYEAGPSMLAVFVAIYGLGSYLPQWTALRHLAVLLGLMMAWTAAGIATLDSVPWSALIAVPICAVLPFALGVADKRRRQRVTELEVASVRREQAGFEAAADAVRAERARIARELHDVVAHEITVMTLQAEGARRGLAGREPELQETLGTIAQSGRKGLEEMQRMIGVLRASEKEAAERADVDRALASGASPALASALDGLSPMPSLAALPSLVRHVQDSGLPVTLEISGSSHVPAGVEVSAYRIVQEALTNALKHAGNGASAEVLVKRTADAVHITVVDDGRGASESARLPGGHGLAGMAERVQALGGALSHGPRRGGGFQVHAVLPSNDDQVTGASAPQAEGVNS